MSKTKIERTNLAEILEHVFAELERCIPTSTHAGTNLFQAWSAVLGGPERTPFDVLASIGQLSSIMIKLAPQIKESKKLKEIQKRSALTTLTLNSIYILQLSVFTKIHTFIGDTAMKLIAGI